jgi:hypothetical protein
MSENRADEPFDALLRHALMRSPGAEPPPGFARSMAERVADLPETGAMERFATLVLLTLAVLGSVACAGLYFDTIASRALQVLGRVPWPLLLAAAATMGAIKLSEFARILR